MSKRKADLSSTDPKPKKAKIEHRIDILKPDIYRDFKIKTSDQVFYVGKETIYNKSKVFKDFLSDNPDATEWVDLEADSICMYDMLNSVYDLENKIQRAKYREMYMLFDKYDCCFNLRTIILDRCTNVYSITKESIDFIDRYGLDSQYDKLCQRYMAYKERVPIDATEFGDKFLERCLYCTPFKIDPKHYWDKVLKYLSDRKIEQQFWDAYNESITKNMPSPLFQFGKIKH